MSTLKRAIEIAADAHKGQKRKYDKGDYINHPLRVKEKLRDRIMDGQILYKHPHVEVAVLHDVVEDTKWTLEDLAKEGFHITTLMAIDAITRKEFEEVREPYLDYLKRCYQNPIAREVKKYDIEDNIEDSIPGASRDKHIVALELFREWDK